MLGLRTRTLVLAGSIAALGGCGDDGGGGGGGLALEEFCPELEAASAATAARCGCASSSTCRITEGSALRAQIDMGTLRYDPAAAGRFVARVRDATCDRTSYEQGATDLDQATMFGTLDGSIDPGGECLSGPPPSGCRQGLCEATICIGRVGEGEACDDLHDCLQPLDGERAESLRCAGGTCQPLAGAGEACGSGDDCLSGRCEGSLCVTGAAVGAPCTMDAECESAHCDFSTERCRPPEPIGGLCTEHIGCESGFCADRLEIGAGRCRAQAADGEACTEHAACTSETCVGGNCTAAICSVIQ
jgi:hypothetical protein